MLENPRKLHRLRAAALQEALANTHLLSEAVRLREEALVLLHSPREDTDRRFPC